MELFFFSLKTSFLNNLRIIPVGVTTKKKTTPITIGETKFPNNNPNLVHNLFNGSKILELNKPRIKKIIDKINDHCLISF